MQLQFYKKRKDQEFPKNWRVANLIDLCLGKPKYGASVPAISKDTSLPRYIRITDLDDEGGLKEKEWASIMEEDAKSYFLSEGDLLFARTGATVGKTYLYNEKDGKCAFAGYLIKFVPNRDLLDPKFLFYYTHSKNYWGWLKSTQTEGVQPNVNAEQYSYMPVVKPPIEEQRKIALILFKVDGLIRKTDQIIEQTQRLKKGLMQKLLTKGIGKKSLKSVSFGPTFLDYDIPNTWQVHTLKECVRNEVPITYGIVQAGPHVPSGVPYIRTGDMSGGKLSKDDLLCTSKEIASSFQRSQVKAGEIVCALRGIVGTVLEVPKELEGANLTQGTARISPCQGIYSRYLLWALRSKYARRQFEIFSKGTTLSEITLEKLRLVKVAIPLDLNEQKDIVSMLDQIELAVDIERRYKEKVIMLKIGLMQNLLTGKVRVKA